MTNSVVLSFHDSLLRNSDYELLDEGRWLNDNVIAFAFEYVIAYYRYALSVIFNSAYVNYVQ
jgi:Ulp1 family protease